MEGIESEISTIEAASRGEEVRDAIVHALRALNMSEEATKAAKAATYTLSIDGHTLTLTSEAGVTQSVTLPNDVEAAMEKQY